MRLRAGLILLLVGLGGCQHLPEGVNLDLDRGTVSVGPCVCLLPRNAPVAVPVLPEPVPAPIPAPAPAPPAPAPHPAPAAPAQEEVVEQPR